MRVVAHPSNLLRPMIVVLLRSGRGVAAAMQHTLRAGSFADVRAESSWQSEYSPRKLWVRPKLCWPQVQRLGWSGMFWKTTLVCRPGETSMMRILGIYMVIKPFLLVTASRCATWNKTFRSRTELCKCLSNMTLRMMEHTFPNFWCAMRYTPPILTVNALCGDHRISGVLSMLII